MKLPAIALTLGLMLASAPAWAEPDLARKEAAARFEEGNQAYAGGRYEEARVKFNQAWANLKRPNVLFNLARAEHLTGHLVDAARHYRHYLRLEDPKITSKDRQGTEKYLTDLREKVGRVSVVAPKGTVITVDGERIEEPDLAEPIEVAPGPHAIAGSWAGKTKQVDVAVLAGAVGNAAFSFDEPPATPSPPAPSAATSASADPGGAAPEAERGVSGRAVLGWTLIGAGVVAAGVGVGYVVASNNAASERDRLKADPGAAQCPASSSLCSDLKDAADSRVARANAAKVLLIAGGATVVGGVVLLLLPGRRSAGVGSAVVAPMIGPSAGGLAAFGRF